MEKRSISLGSELIYIISSMLLVIAVIRFSKPISALTIIGIAIASCILTIVDLISTKCEDEEGFSKLPKIITFAFSRASIKAVKALTYAAFFILLACLVFAGYIPMNMEESTVYKMGDILLFFTVTIVMMTYAIKNHKRDLSPDVDSEVRIDDSQHDKVITQEQALSKVVTEEYNTMIYLDALFDKLKLIDRNTFSYGQVHNGWSLFHDSLEGFYRKQSGPFYDLYLSKRFWDFAAKIGNASSILANMSNPDSSKVIETISVWGVELEVSSFKRIWNHNSLNDALEHIDKASEMWEGIKNTTIKYYNKHK